MLEVTLDVGGGKRVDFAVEISLHAQGFSALHAALLRLLAAIGPSKRGPRARQPRHHRADGHIRDRRYLAIVHFLDFPQHQHRAVLFGQSRNQPIEGALLVPADRGVLRIRAPSRSWRSRLVHRFPPAAARRRGAAAGRVPSNGNFSRSPAARPSHRSLAERRSRERRAASPPARRRPHRRDASDSHRANRYAASRCGKTCASKRARFSSMDAKTHRRAILFPVGTLFPRPTSHRRRK